LQSFQISTNIDVIFSQDETLGFHDASFTNTKNKSEFFKLAKISRIFPILISLKRKSLQSHKLGAVLNLWQITVELFTIHVRLSSLADCWWIPGVLGVSSGRALRFSLQAVVPHGLGPHEVHHSSHNHPANHHHHEISWISSSIALSRAWKTILQTLVVSAVTLRRPQERQQPPHGHLMVEDALTGVKSVCHLDVMCFVYS